MSVSGRSIPLSVPLGVASTVAWVDVGSRVDEDDAVDGIGGSGGGIASNERIKASPADGWATEGELFDMEESAASVSFRLTTGRGRGLVFGATRGEVNEEIDVSGALRIGCMGRTLGPGGPKEDMSDTIERFRVNSVDCMTDVSVVDCLLASNRWRGANKTHQLHAAGSSAGDS